MHDHEEAANADGAEANPQFSEVDPEELRRALVSLPLLGEDLYLSMQALNLAIVDPFLAHLESSLLEHLVHDERTPVPEATFLSAQSQMWIFAVYELLRTWRGRLRDILKWLQSGGLDAKRAALERDVGYPHAARLMRANQIRRVQWNGALDYELENGAYSLGYLSRRDIADELRALSASGHLPSDEELAEFDAFMRGTGAAPFSA